MWPTSIETEVAHRREALRRVAGRRQPGRRRPALRMRIGLFLVRVGLAVAQPVTPEALHLAD
jgi:hypothetical protein